MPPNSLILPVARPFDFEQCLTFLRRSDDEVMHVATEDALWKLFDIDGRLWLGEIKAHGQGLIVTLHDEEVTTGEQLVVERYVREWFDLDQDVAAFERFALNDDLLRPIVQRYTGLRLIGFPDLFEALAWAVIGQQITLSFAYTLKRRFVERYGYAREAGGVTYWAFPRPEDIALLVPADLRAMQFSTRKAEYIIGIAREIANGTLSKQALRQQSREVVHARLLSIRGVGEWTAEYVRMKCLQDRQAFPATDAGLHQALKFHLERTDKLTAEQMQEMRVRFSGWEAYATFYLWRSLYGNV
ncbi:DNA-3-methyladenine glycosylase family protein [Exiguobacterium alkaliphilum]|uniref:DNA-3-methyladenine glycosylase II n=1 Tax=Exiguobacterium alkaliphilum TaxID=1428684 RepID=A0ABT2KWW0_9BACL|nr:AlkA N-terminal domain-containing protein [Exiguobacterium alkaliphilum]MCT4795038.1 DNA-3-methyladenine glycosylase 2 [Exiguobacterium alkaliphilum]